MRAGHLYPLTKETLLGAAAVLKAGNYGYAPQHLDAMKKQHLVRGQVWSACLDMTLKDSTRSCLRGLEPAAQAQPLRLADGAWLAEARPMHSKDGPRAMTVGCRGRRREIEVAN